MLDNLYVQVYIGDIILVDEGSVSHAGKSETGRT